MKKTIIAAVLLILSAGGYFYFFFTNFHEVDRGVLYRSKQMSAAQLDDAIKRYHIKTVVNLRGASPKAEWYRDEIRISSLRNVEHLDFRLSATRYLSPRTLDSIITIVASARRPLIVHCKGGADRAGLISAAWKLKVDNESPQEALKQLSFFYGHIPCIYDKTEEMDRSFTDYVAYVSAVDSDTEKVVINSDTPKPSRGELRNRRAKLWFSGSGHRDPGTASSKRPCWIDRLWRRLFPANMLFP